MSERWLSTLNLFRAVAGVLVVLAQTSATAAPTSDVRTTDEGRRLYQFYCYQCHGYAGDAKTLASTYLAPTPRDFASTPADSLSLETMIDTVLHGKAGTAMVGFSSVLSLSQAQAVVGYVRNAFMTDAPQTETYHSAANGWPDHDRYSAAFAYVEGTLTLDVAWESLTESQRTGRRLYETACVTCHDQPADADVDPLIWELRAVSYPRRHYSHRQSADDWVSAASPYRLHDAVLAPQDLTDEQILGKRLFEANCAFCHAIDGSGRNWIGSFLEPRPRDLSDPALHRALGPAGLKARIRYGIPDTSMPAWMQVLSDSEIDAIVAYVRSGLAAEP